MKQYSLDLFLIYSERHHLKDESRLNSVVKNSKMTSNGAQILVFNTKSKSLCQASTQRIIGDEKEKTSRIRFPHNYFAQYRVKNNRIL